eukprot:scaffold48_cov311-Pinguiococcus_pyrenoidosus.AAC.57
MSPSLNERKSVKNNMSRSDERRDWPCGVPSASSETSGSGLHSPWPDAGGIRADTNTKARESRHKGERTWPKKKKNPGGTPASSSAEEAMAERVA